VAIDSCPADLTPTDTISCHDSCHAADLAARASAVELEVECAAGVPAAVGSVGAGCATGPGILLAGRVVQGLDAARFAPAPASLSVLTTTLLSTHSAQRTIGAEGGPGVPTNMLTITWDGRPVRLTVVGEIDLATRQQFEQALARTLGTDGDTQLDLRGVPFMDTHSVTAVVHCANRLHREGGRLIVHHPPASLLRIFEILWGDDGGSRLHISGHHGES
jgi:anti-anti-sigma factor